MNACDGISIEELERYEFIEIQDGLLPRHVLQQQIVELEKQREELLAAGQALVDRWDTPNWKDAPHTGEFIARLRAAIGNTDGNNREKALDELAAESQKLGMYKERFTRIHKHLERGSHV